MRRGSSKRTTRSRKRPKRRQRGIRVSRPPFRRITSGTAICAVLCSAVAVPFGAWAQNNDRGGMWTQLRLTERFLTRDTTSPDPSVDGITNQLVTDLDFDFSSETRTEKVTLDFGAEYRFTDGPTTDGFEGEFMSPELRLRYDQKAASASIMVTATASQVNLADVSPLSVTTSTDEALASDFAALEDGGTRTQLGFNSRLTLRDDAPFGLILGFLVNDVSYQDLPASSTLDDSTTARADVTGRFDITEVFQVRAGVFYAHTDTDGAPQTDRYGINTSATLTQPNGAYTLNADWSDGDGGAITNLSVGRSFELPQTKTSFALGVAQSTNDTFYATGTASLEHDFGRDSALGPFTLSADRSVTLTGRTDEEVVTSLAMGGSYALSPVANLRLNAELGQAEEVASGDTVTLSEVSLTLGYQLGTHWRAAADVRGKRRDPSDSGVTESTTLSVSLSRVFDSQF